MLTTLLLLRLQMLSCLEHMYHDLGLVRDFSINPVTLRRWLVSSSRSLPPGQVSWSYTAMDRGASLMALGFLQLEAASP